MLWLIAAAAAFAPPVDRPLHYEIRQVRPTSTGDATFTTRYEVRFARLGDGYRIDRTMTACETDATGARRLIFDAGMKPFLGVTVSARLDLKGRPTGMIDMSTAWAKLSATLRHVIASAEAEPAFTDQTRAIFRQQIGSMLAMPPAGQEALLLQGIDQMVPALPMPDTGTSLPWSIEATGATAAPVRLTGSIRRADGQGAIDLAIDLAAAPSDMAAAAGAIRAALPPGAPEPQRKAIEAMAVEVARSTLVEHGHVAIDAADGLVRDSRIETAMRRPGVEKEQSIVVESVHRID